MNVNVLQAIGKCIDEIIVLMGHAPTVNPDPVPPPIPADTPPIPTAPVPIRESPEMTDPNTVPMGETITKDLGPSYATGGGVLDTEGIPWDARIHSGGKTFYASGAKMGQWKVKRGVDPIALAQIKTELLLAQGGGPAPTPGPSTTVPAPGVPAATPSIEIVSWAQLVEAATVANIAPDVMQAACDKFNVANFGALQDVPILVPMIAKELGL